jgi:hypothetical protein
MGDTVVDERMTLNETLNLQSERMWNGFVCVRTGTGDGAL